MSYHLYIHLPQHISMFKDNTQFCREVGITDDNKIYCKEDWYPSDSLPYGAFKYTTVTLSPEGKSLAHIIHDILAETIDEAEIKSTIYLLLPLGRECVGMDVADIIPYVKEHPTHFMIQHEDKSLKYGIVTGIETPIFRREAHNNNRNTFDFVSVQINLVDKETDELHKIVQSHLQDLMRDALGAIKKSTTWQKNEIPLSFLEPYAATITKNKTFQIDFQLKTIASGKTSAPTGDVATKESDSSKI